MASDERFPTRCIHAGQVADPYGAPYVPVYNTTTFGFTDTQALREAAAAPDRRPLYTRYGSNPTIFAVERQLAALEGGEAALVFGAGMAAISAVCMAHGQGGVAVVGNAYGGTLELVSERLPALGWRGHLAFPDEMEALDEVLSAGFGVVIIETPGNPDLAVLDIGAVAEAAHLAGALLVVDSTFASPVNQNPLALGADLVVHSATKYLGGHSDLTAGAVMGPGALLEPVAGWRKTLGQTPSPETAALLARSLRTLDVRMQRHNANAQRIAEAMANHPAVRQVHYPGLPDHPDHALARRQMRAFGGMLSLTLEGDAAGAMAMVDALELFLNAPSLGGVESLVTQPVMTSHADLDERERARRGIGETMVRLSVGLEDADDLIADLEQALARAG
ncbi:PLP-dependent aspartate aminotransferase family protein [Arhodomonas sp. KWT2]|uniref:trans-sulfuration enzyme family protein n=1 Tax=Arhodomonas sp. KWT2 TaxID=3344194 RepID=UPI0035C24337